MIRKCPVWFWVLAAVVILAGCETDASPRVDPDLAGLWSNNLTGEDRVEVEFTLFDFRITAPENICEWTYCNAMYGGGYYAREQTLTSAVVSEPFYYDFYTEDKLTLDFYERRLDSNPSADVIYADLVRSDP